jgi:hypothetical protein
MSLRHSLRLAVGVLPLVALLPSTAYAERVVSRDPAGDALVTSEVDGVEQSAVAPEQRTLDIVRTVVDHRSDVVLVRVQFRRLATDPLMFIGTRLRLPRGKVDVLVEHLGGKPIVSGAAHGSREIACPGLEAHVQRSTRSTVLSVPTACLGDARWVRVGVVAYGVDLDQEDGARVSGVYSDDAHRDGTFDVDKPAVGPKVRRG